MPEVSDEEALRIHERIIQSGRANETQPEGTHYQELAGEKGEQHWDMMWRLYREAWFVGNITKYVLRYRKKNGMRDLHKARHYLKKLIELEEEAAMQEQDQVNPTPTGYQEYQGDHSDNRPTMNPCPACQASGFKASRSGTGCEFCDGTEGGNYSEMCKASVQKTNTTESNHEGK